VLRRAGRPLWLKDGGLVTSGLAFSPLFLIVLVVFVFVIIFVVVIIFIVFGVLLVFGVLIVRTDGEDFAADTRP
jgi:hypothetical protein